MAKGVKKKSKSKKVKLSAKWIVIFIIIALIVGVIAYQMIAKALEKHNLLEKYKKLDAVAAKIEAQYPPDSKTSEKYCVYSSIKFEKGTLVCHYDIDLSYTVNNIELANEKKDSIGTINSADFKNNSYKETNFIANVSLSSDGSLYQDLSAENMPGCIISYSYNTVSHLLLVRTHCSDIARAEYFPPKGY